MAQHIDFPFSDLIAGYVDSITFKDEKKQIVESFTLKTSDNKIYNILMTDITFSEIIRNLGEPFMDASTCIDKIACIGRYVFVYGIFYPEEQSFFEAKHIVLTGRYQTEYIFEKPNWWIDQIEQLADFYLHAEFGLHDIDYRRYRTQLDVEGDKETTNYRQETDTISRLVYGFASAYLLTGKERYLEAAEKGTKYLREHFRAFDSTQDLVYWYHAIDIYGDRVKKVFASEFGDDFNAIPAYEQIYALTGPVQTYRITGDREIYDDACKTINLFRKYFFDQEYGGYFSHIHPITFQPDDISLKNNQSRKNWNSNGDHTPAYLINLYLATQNKELKEMLSYTSDIITQYFPDYENSVFVQERFHADWSKDTTWDWQQNRAVIGHNLKIAWNLTRVYNLDPKPEYKALAEKIAALMPKYGNDSQRGGWYDVMERKLEQGQKHHRFIWHDRKAWWQQEQGILAYLILYGSYKDENQEKNPEYLRLARESEAFYNAWFLDHEAGGIFFNVLANGIPYLLGTERNKGSHSMSGYHAFELCYLAAIYNNLLINKQSMDFHFKPNPKYLTNGLLYVAPDLLPPHSIKITEVFVDGCEHKAFNAENLSVDLSNYVKDNKPIKVIVTIAPTTGLNYFETNRIPWETSIELECKGKLDARALKPFREILKQHDFSKDLVLNFTELEYFLPEAINSLFLVKHKLDKGKKIYVKDANEQVRQVLEKRNTGECFIFE